MVNVVATPTEPVFREVDGRSLSAVELEQLVDLVQTAFDGRFTGDRFAGQLSPVEHYGWKLEGPPARPSRTTIAEVDSRIVASSLQLKRLFLVAGVERTVRDSVDGTVHPDFQGRGISSARKRFHQPLKTEDLKVGLQDHPAEVHLARKHGQLDFANPIRLMTRTRHAWWLAAQSRGGLARRLLVPLRASRTAALMAATRMRSGRPSTRDIGWDIVTASRFDARVDELFDDAASGFDFIQVRRHNYLNWRFCDPRAGPFVIRVAEEDGVMLGYAVLASIDGRGNIADLLARPGRSDVVESLVRDATVRFEVASPRGARPRRC